MFTWVSKIRPTALLMAGISVFAHVQGAEQIALILAGAAAAMCVDGNPPVVPASVVEKLMELMGKDKDKE